MANRDSASSSSSLSGRPYTAHSHKVSSPGLSAEELKKRLYHSFRERGLVDSLKSQLRTKLVAELQQSTSVAPRSRQDHDGLQDEGSLFQRAANSLVADHLKRCNYNYTLAVFLPESGGAKDKLFTLHDLLDLLKIHPDSKLGRKLISDLSSYQSKGLLWRFLCEVARSHQGGSEEKGIQVDEHPSHLTSIESKLKSVDVFYNNKAEEESLTHHGTMQEKLLSIQRQMEARCKMETNLEISRFKESELKRVELDQRDKCRQENDRVRKEMEYTYRAKSEALQERERSSMERLQKEKEHFERETYTQRQSLLKELHVLRQRESELKREAEVNGRAAKLEEERCKTMEENLKVREIAIANIQDTYENRLKEQTRQYELEMQAKYSNRLHEVEESETKLRVEKRNLQQESEALKGLKDDLKNKQARLTEVETLLQQVRHEAVAMEKRNEMLNEKVRDMIDYQTVKETNAVLRREVDNAKMRVSDITNEQRMERARHEESLKQMAEQLSRPSPELVTLQGDLARARQQTQQERTVLEHRDAQLRTTLQEEREQNLELRRQMDDQSKQMAEMNQQLSDLRATLRETQTALSNEIYRRPPLAATVTRPPVRSDHVPVRDYIDPEDDQYIDTTLHQSHVSPTAQLLLGSAGKSKRFASVPGVQLHPRPESRQLPDNGNNGVLSPSAGLDTTGPRGLLAGNGMRGIFAPMAGLDTTGPRRLVAHGGNSGAFAPMAGLEATASDEGEVSADNSLAFLEETRQRFRQLEKEAENLEQTYQNFQHRATNPHALSVSLTRHYQSLHTLREGQHSGTVEFATPMPARPTGIGHKDKKTERSPEPLVEYPLRDSMESSTVSQYKTLPLQKRETPSTGTRIGLITEDVQATPLEGFPLEDTMDSTKFSQGNKSVQTDSGVHSETKQNVSLPKRDFLSMKTLLPPYESSAHHQGNSTTLESFPLEDTMDSTKFSQGNKSVQTDNSAFSETKQNVPLLKRDFLSMKTLLPSYESSVHQQGNSTTLESFPLEDTIDSTKFSQGNKSVQTNNSVLSETKQNVPLLKRDVLSMKTLLPPYESSVHQQGKSLSIPSRQQPCVSDKIPKLTEQSKVVHKASLTHSGRYSSGKLEPPSRSSEVQNFADQSQVTIREHSVSSLSEHSLPLDQTSLPYTQPAYKPTQIQAENQPNRNDSSSEDDLTGGSLSHLSERDSTVVDQDKEENRQRRLCEEEEQEEREWEEKRKQKEEERKKMEDEARDREHRMLMKLQQEEQTQSSLGVQNVADESKAAGEDNDERIEDEGEVTKDAEDLRIDPVMQKYMQMVQQKKQQEMGSKVKKSEEGDIYQKSSSGLSQGSMSAEEIEAVDKPSSHGASSEDGDPFDDW